MTIFFSIVFLISSITLIVSVLMQESKSEGLGALTGGGQNVFGKSRFKTLESLLSRITTISAIVFMISALVLAVI